MSIASAEICARRGAQFLDEVHPGWDSEIDLVGLQLISSEFCVLGQLFDDAAASHETGFDWAVANFIQIQLDGPGALGFDVDGEISSNTYEELDDAWSTLIHDRRRQRKALATYAENIAFSGATEATIKSMTFEDICANLQSVSDSPELVDV